MEKGDSGIDLIGGIRSLSASGQDCPGTDTGIPRVMRNTAAGIFPFRFQPSGVVLFQNQTFRFERTNNIMAEEKIVFQFDGERTMEISTGKVAKLANGWSASATPLS